MKQLSIELLETIRQRAWTLGYKNDNAYIPHYPFVRLCSDNVVAWKWPFTFVFAVKLPNEAEAEKFYEEKLKDKSFNKIRSYNDCNEDYDCFMEEQDGMILLPEIPMLYEYEKNQYSQMEYVKTYCKPSEIPKETL